MWILLFASVCFFVAVSQANERVSEKQCLKIRKKANHWKPSPLSPYNDADLITPNLFLGNVCAAHNDFWLEMNEITMVISVAREWSFLPYHGTREIKFFHFLLDDSINEDGESVRNVLKEVARLIDSVRNEKVLVHCNMGISRSASVVLYYLMEYEMRGISYTTLEKFVKSKRPVTKPNPLYRRILLVSKLQKRDL